VTFLSGPIWLESACDAFRISKVRTQENNLVETLPQPGSSETRLTITKSWVTVKTVTTEPILSVTSLFRLSLAQTPEDLMECQRLRYLVFNLELGEGLSSSERSGLDIDPFDPFCDHLMVRDAESRRLVGTYRMQMGVAAKQNLGYYGNELFDFSPFEPVRKQVLELGRACVHEDFRNMMVLHALWKGIAAYASRVDARYLLGCNSISSQNENYGIALYQSLKDKYLVEPAFRTLPQPGCLCHSTGHPVEVGRSPRLFRAYLDVSARLCGSPAIDREFKTSDFLSLVDLGRLPDRVRVRFF
jgi:putative hemolysin